MGFRWHFNRVKAGDKIREPIHGEFFAAEAIANPGEALIREGIQNSLDAGQPGCPVTVRIFLSGESQAAAPRDMNPFMEGLWPHIQAESNGLRDVPSPRDSCPFLVFEDFGTTGLTGDTSQWQPLPGVSNNFFNFYRADGRSDRAKHERGRWGVGKQVFTRSSRIRTFFAMTVRADDKRRILLGQAALRSHFFDGVYHSPDGWFGLPPQTTHDGLVRAVEDPLWMKRFEELFDLKRHREPGLSLVIPWYCDDLAPDVLVRSILRHYFWPILQGQLQVCLQSPERSTVLDAEMLNAPALPDAVDPDLAPILQLARWATTVDADRLTVLQMTAPEQPWRWSADRLPQPVRNALRGRYEAGEQIALRVPVTVREKAARPRASFFDVFMQRDPSEKTGRPLFIREGLTIPDVRAPRTHGVRSLVVAEHPPIAGFLGDSENPAHTQWQKQSSKFRGKYESGAVDLDFVIQAVHQINRMLCCSDQQLDHTLLTDLFSLPARDESHGWFGAEDRHATGQPPDQIRLLSSYPQGFQIERTQRGFVLRKSKEELDLPTVIALSVAYDVRAGNPFTRWRPTDFELGAPPIELQAKGAQILTSSGNKLHVRVTSDRFRLQVEGFDRRRDLRLLVTQLDSDTAGSEEARNVSSNG